MRAITIQYGTFFKLKNDIHFDIYTLYLRVILEGYCNLKTELMYVVKYSTDIRDGN